MAVEIIGKLKPKNNGDFALMDAADVEMPDGKRLPGVIGNIIDINSGAMIQVWFGTEEEYKALDAAGEIKNEIYYNIVEDEVVT